MSAIAQLVGNKGRLNLDELCPTDKRSDPKMRVTAKRVVIFIIVVVVLCLTYVLLSGHFIKKRPASDELHPGQSPPQRLNGTASISPVPQSIPTASADPSRLFLQAVKEAARWKEDKELNAANEDTSQELAHHFNKQLQQQQLLIEQQAKILQQLSARLQDKEQSEEKKQQQQQQQQMQDLREIPQPMAHVGADDKPQGAFPVREWDSRGAVFGGVRNSGGEVQVSGFHRLNLKGAAHPMANTAGEESAVSAVKSAADGDLRSNGLFRQNPAQLKTLIDAAAMFEQARQRAGVPGGDQQNQETSLVGGIRGPPAPNGAVKDAAKMFEEAGRRTQQKIHALNGQIYDRNRHLAHQKGYFDKVGRWPLIRRDVSSVTRRLMNDVQDQAAVNSDHFGQMTDRLKNVRTGDGAGTEIITNDFSNTKLDRISDIHKAHVTVYDLTRPAEGTFKCVPLKLWTFSRSVCVHSHNIDSIMSERLLNRGMWEEEELAQFLHALDTQFALGAVDLGAGLGIYSLAAASKFRPVLAVEPLYANYRLFHKTAQLNAITDRVTLVTNALGAEAGLGRLVYPHPTGNLGAAYLQPVNGTDRVRDPANVVRIVSLDDLIPVLKFRTAVLKLDVQGDEHNVLRGGKRFFSVVNVPYVLTHWLYTQNPDTYREAGALLSNYGYEPARAVHGKELYTETQLTGDINFIVWRKTALSP